MDFEKHGFTMMEAFVIMIVLGVIASVVVPKFSEASSQARLSYMVSDLHKMRSQIELYKIQHNDLLPGQRIQGGSVSEETFVKALTGKSSQGLGPYVREIPVNSFNGMSSVHIELDPNKACTGTEEAGWWFNAATGDFRACNSSAHKEY